MIKGIPAHLQISEKEMDEEENKRGYPALKIMKIISEDEFVIGIKEIGKNEGFLISWGEHHNYYRIMPFITDMQGMIQFSYRVGCVMERFVWSKTRG